MPTIAQKQCNPLYSKQLMLDKLNMDRWRYFIKMEWNCILSILKLKEYSVFHNNGHKLGIDQKARFRTHLPQCQCRCAAWGDLVPANMYKLNINVSTSSSTSVIDLIEQYRRNSFFFLTRLLEHFHVSRCTITSCSYSHHFIAISFSGVLDVKYISYYIIITGVHGN